jgi:hypothetical protein
MLDILLASQLAGARPIPNEMWFSPDDVPSYLESGAYRTSTQTLLDKTGSVVGCRVEMPSSEPKMDALACSLILKRGKFTPAHWSDGTPVPSLFRYTLVMSVDQYPPKPGGDVEITVDKLPKGIRSPLLLSLDYAVDETGKITDCVGAPSVGAERPKPNDPALVALACRELIAGWKPFTVLDETGRPGRSVQNAFARITVSREPKR